MSRWLQSLTKPLGLMACNDDRARQVVEACKLAGVSLPGQIGIVGVDNDDVVCGLSDPPLSSVAVNFEQAGYEAAGGQNCAAPGRASLGYRERGDFLARLRFVRFAGGMHGGG
jgi:LacI family transcriptional regulator